MFKNYFKTAWRSLINNKAYSLLNILGLSAGMSVALMIGLWVHYQYSYDRWLPDHQLAFRAGTTYLDHGERQTSLVTALPLVDALKKDIPGIRYVAQTDWMRSRGLMAGDKKIYTPGAMAGSDFLKIFQYPFVRGDADNALKEPYSIVLTESTARALFGGEDPINKMVRIDNNNDLRVTGVLKDIPVNSTFQFNFVVPYEYLLLNDEGVRRASTSWEMVTSQVFVGLQPNVSYAQIQPALKKLRAKYNPGEYARSKLETILHPMDAWHLYSEFKNGRAAGGFIEYIRLFAVIGILVLGIACINFINLSTASSERRAKEVGIRKTIGSRRGSLILQFLVESTLLAAIAFLLSLSIVELFLPAFNTLTASAISIDYTSGLFWGVMLAYVLVTGLLAGVRPAFYLSSFKPVKVLKNAIRTGRSATLARRALVVLQFTCSMTLIISTIIIYQQIQYAKARPSGYDRSRLMMTDANAEYKKSYQALKTDLVRSGLVTAITASSSPVTEHRMYSGVDNWQGKRPDESVGLARVAVADGDFFRTLGIALIEGRDFIGASDSANVILNESAVRKMHFTQALGQVITWDGQVVRVVGVVSDAIVSSPFAAADPAIFLYRPDWSRILTYRLAPAADTRQAIARLAAIFSKYNPSIPYVYKFVDEVYDEKFFLETLIGKLSGLFASLAIFISCLGLFGLAAYMAEQRKKEIGIRKVLGATIVQVWMMLSGDFIVLVGIASLIAAPLAFLFLHGWLQHYSYRISMGPGVFIATSIGGIALTVCAISYQAIRAATTNPVKSLRMD